MRFFKLRLFLLFFSPLILIQLEVPMSLCQEPNKDIPTIARDALKAVVLIVVSDSSGKEIKQGSGIVVTSDGKIITNFHVIEGGSSAVVKFPNGAFYLVEGIYAADKKNDLAVLKAAGSDFPVVPLGDSDKVQVGEEVVSIGSPLALEATVSNGIISSVRDFKDENLRMFQTTAPISHGSSGGALLNMRGEVIGITTAQLSGGQNLNFAVPIDNAKTLLTAGSLKKITPDFSGQEPAMATTEGTRPTGGAPTSTTWQREQETDPLRGITYARFSLAGKFLTEPKSSPNANPIMIVRCLPGRDNHGHTNGKFAEGYILVGGVVDSSVSENGNSFVPVQLRLDDGKLQSEDWGRSTNFSAIFFSHPTCPFCRNGYDVFANLLYGHHLYHKENTAPQVRKIIIGLREFLGGEVVMQFDLPDATEVSEACGIVWHK